jgi:hypothetical protein
MGSIMDSRYWTCPSCCCQFDWEKGEPQGHDSDECRRELQEEEKILLKKRKTLKKLGGEDSSSDIGWVES